MEFCQDNVLRTSAACVRLVQDRNCRIAESLQQVVMRTFPGETVPGIHLATYYKAALEEATVGGDTCDAFLLTGGRVALVVADASGKGLAAAERVAEIRFALRAFLREHSDPERALSCLNDFVYNDFVYDTQRLGRRGDSTFATLTLVVLNEVSGKAVCFCAGGEPPRVLRADGSVEVVQICGAALGLLPGQRYAAATLRLERSDTVLLTTDGLTEARQVNLIGSRVGPFFGIEGLIQLTLPARGCTASLCQIGRLIFDGTASLPVDHSMTTPACFGEKRNQSRLEAIS